MILGFIIIGTVTLTIGICMHYDLLDPRPFYVKMYCGIVAALTAMMFGYVTLVLDKNSSKKTDDILATTKGTGSDVIDLRRKADTSNAKIDILREENDSLKLQITDLDSKLSEQNNTVINLTQQTADLSIRLAEKAKNIYDLNTAIKFPLPNSIHVSYWVEFQLDESIQRQVDEIISGDSDFDMRRKEQVSSPSAYLPVNYALVSHLIWYEGTRDLVKVIFAKDLEEVGEKVSYNAFLTFSNYGSYRNSETRLQEVNKKLLYNPVYRKLMLIFDVELDREYYATEHLEPSITSTSLHDLDKSTMVFKQVFPSRFTSFEVLDFEISSKELNIRFNKLIKSMNGLVFTSSVNLFENQ